MHLANLFQTSIILLVGILIYSVTNKVNVCLEGHTLLVRFYRTVRFVELVTGVRV